jgi:S-DNA-T family DNA segregation ATPase FtsK/SpoIIIE
MMAPNTPELIAISRDPDPLPQLPPAALLTAHWENGTVMRDLIESSAYRGSAAELPIALGWRMDRLPMITDLAQAPHLLIGGTTGSGKSVFIDAILTSLLYRHSATTLQLLLIDPNGLDLSLYRDLPHLRHPVVTDVQEAEQVLTWVVTEIERRSSLLQANGMRSMQDFNRCLDGGQMMRAVEVSGPAGDPDRWVYQGGRLPYLVVIIAQLAGLKMGERPQLATRLVQIAQKGRVTGIHLVLSTQHVSGDTVPRTVRANMPSRIAFRTASRVDSRLILDRYGAEILRGNGEMLFLPTGELDPIKVQGPLVTGAEVEELGRWYRERADVHRKIDLLSIMRSLERGGDIGDDDFLGERDCLFREAAELCIQDQGGSTALLQRRLRIGYGRAARIVDQLHHAGVLGPPDGSKPREVRVDLHRLDAICPRVVSSGAPNAPPATHSPNVLPATHSPTFIERLRQVFGLGVRKGPGR